MSYLICGISVTFSPALMTECDTKIFPVDAVKNSETVEIKTRNHGSSN